MSSMKQQPSPAHVPRRAAATARTPSRKRAPTSPTHDEQIRLAAYVLCERRGFVPGHELEDWLRAEAQILLAGDDGSTK